MESTMAYFMGTLAISLAVILKIFFSDFTDGLGRQLFADQQTADTFTNCALFFLMLLGFVIILLRYTMDNVF